MSAKACNICVTATSDWAREVARWRDHTGNTPAHKSATDVTALEGEPLSDDLSIEYVAML
jgi:hypothetical protein